MLQKIKNLTKDSGFLRYFANTSWVFGGKVLQMVSALFIGVWVARYLGPEKLGILSYAQSFTALFLALSTLGLNGILVRELVKNPKDTNTLLGTSFILQSIGSAILMLILILITYYTEQDDLTSKIILILGSVTFLDSFAIIGIYFQSIVRSKFVVFIGIFVLLISSIAKITFILIDFPLIAFVYLILAESVLTTCGLIYFYIKNNGSLLGWNFSITMGKQLLKDCWPLILSGIIVSIYMKIDQVMIKEMKDAAAVGQYSAAVRLSEAWYFIPTVISGSLFPAIINAKQRNEALYYERLQKLYDLMVILSITIALPMTFLSDWLILILYGKEYYMSGGVLSLHIWAGVFVFLGVSREGWILSENLQRYTILYLGLGMAFNIILNFLLIPNYGIFGAAVATLVAQAISVLFAPLIFKETRISFNMMIKALTFYSIINRFLKR
ncbi:flippase [Maribacter sp. Asnod2-G09]|uniref:flippase n=1 Tax=Maribacter sp. Asnod2-G09 TaxID=3160577 RepID=UPI0038633C13